jgi:dephospho-CoA kinase|tara:strand:+ start:3672 stop:4268 length:597 start_codon:yes stop_codon:yes gene_type:complete
MSKIIGLTGGIGSGKSTVARMFESFGVPVYISDDEAKILMESSKSIRQSLVLLFGENAYANGVLNRVFIASKVFNDSTLLSKLNAIVHPEVRVHFESWLKKQTSPYVIKEVAILFETNSQSNFDFIISVVAPVEERVQRVMKGHQKTEQEVRSIIKNQLPDTEKIKLSNFVIYNNSISETKTYVANLHKQILHKIIKS